MICMICLRSNPIQYSGVTFLTTKFRGAYIIFHDRHFDDETFVVGWSPNGRREGDSALRERTSPAKVQSSPVQAEKCGMFSLHLFDFLVCFFFKSACRQTSNKVMLENYICWYDLDTFKR